MSMMSLGFGFEAKDKNLLNFANQLNQGFANVKTNLIGTNQASGVAAQGFGNFGKSVTTTSKVIQGGFKGALTTFEFFMGSLKGAGKLAFDLGKTVFDAVADKAGKMTDAILSSNLNLT